MNVVYWMEAEGDAEGFQQLMGFLGMFRFSYLLFFVGF